MANDKNFSESKISSSAKKCRGCGESVPKMALAFSNSVAIEHHFCCWMCMLSDLGDKKAYQVLSNKTKENREKR